MTKIDKELAEMPAKKIIWKRNIYTFIKTLKNCQINLKITFLEINSCSQKTYCSNGIDGIEGICWVFNGLKDNNND